MANKGSLVELPLATYWVKEHLQFGQSLCNHNQECNIHHYAFWPISTNSIDQSLILPACDLRTLALTYITPESFPNSVPFTDSFFAGNNPAKPFSMALVNSL